VRGVEPFKRLIRAYRRADPFRVDLAIAALFVAAMVLEASIEKTGGDSRVVTAITGSLAMLPLAWRRRNTLAAVLALAVLILVQPLVHSFFFGQQTNAPEVAGMLMSYSAGRYLSGRRLWAAACSLLVALGIGIALSQTYEGPVDLVWVGILFLPPLIAGQAIRNRVALRRELREKAERTEGERQVAAQRAVEEERDRIASELQALVANGVSAMVVQAEAVPRLLAVHDVARASDALEVIEETGRDALSEMRRLLGVLRREGQRPELAPQPGLARLGALIDRARGEGLEIELHTEGERRPLAQGIDLTAFRVLQDGLQGAANAAATHVGVTLRHGSRDIELEVADDRQDGPDTPLAGLRERVTLYGGHVRAERREAGGYVLEARLPARAPSEQAMSMVEAAT
jgi:signal transduction histidine kinase